MAISMDGKRGLLLLFALAGCCAARPARATIVEMSGMVAYSKSNFSDGYSSMQRRYTGTIDFKFTAVSAFELEYTDSRANVTDLTDIGGQISEYVTESTTYRDKIYSFNWVQNLVPTSWIIQPYFIIGGGRMRRAITQEYPELGVSQSTVQSVFTGTGGLGARVFFTKHMAVKAEAKTYVPKFHFAEWKNSEELSVGLDWAF
jgi:hypothetical protein